MIDDNEFEVSVMDGKYTVVQPSNHTLHALRYGETWRDCTGDNLIFALASELNEARETIERSTNTEETYVVIREMSAGNESVGDMWQETKAQWAQ